MDPLSSNDGKPAPTRKAKAEHRFLYTPLLRNWLHQSVSYMDGGEMALRLLAEATAIALALIPLRIATGSWLIASVASIAFVHSAFWILNGNYWALLLFATPQARNAGAKATASYLNDLTDRLSAASCVTGVAIFGSLARREWHSRSDIDLRILRRGGLRGLLEAGMILMRERFFAFVERQPIDMYLADDIDFLLKMRPDEPPIFTVKRDQRLDRVWPDAHPVILTADHFIDDHTS